MLKPTLYISLILAVAAPVWPQASMNITNFSNNGGYEMMAPPPVSGDAYPTGFTSNTRSNYLRLGMTVNTSYSDNILPGVGATPISDILYSIYPRIAFDKTTTRQQWTLSYLPGFTFYQRTSSYDQMDQRVASNFRYRFTPHITGTVQENLLKTSSVLSQPDLLSGNAVSGSTEPSPVTVIAPVANQLLNVTNFGLTYQFARNGMVGGSGSFTNLHFSDPAQVPGLSDSNSNGGLVFYSHRLFGKQYIGVAYRYARFVSYQQNQQNDTQTQTVTVFYTFYLTPTLSLSFSGGPQYSNTAQTPLPSHSSWSPSGEASMGWQGRRTNFAIRYSQVITGGGGLIGAYHSNVANAFMRWQLTRTWGIGAAATYTNFANVVPLSSQSGEGGHTLFGTVSMQHPLGQHFQVEFGYTRLHQSYSDIPLISNAPNTNREQVTFSYQFARPLGGG